MKTEKKNVFLKLNEKVFPFLFLWASEITAGNAWRRQKFLSKFLNILCVQLIKASFVIYKWKSFLHWFQQFVFQQLITV